MIQKGPHSQRGCEKLCELDRVALLADIPQEKLETGHVGTVVFEHEGSDDYEVEFLHDDRRSIILTVPRRVLLKLRGLQFICAATQAQAQAHQPQPQAPQ